MIQKTSKAIFNGVVGATFLVLIGAAMLKEVLRNVK